MSISLIGEITPTPSAELKTVPADRVSYVLIGEDADGQRLDNFLFRIAKGVPRTLRGPAYPYRAQTRRHCSSRRFGHFIWTD